MLVRSRMAAHDLQPAHVGHDHVQDDNIGALVLELSRARPRHFPLSTTTESLPRKLEFD